MFVKLVGGGDKDALATKDKSDGRSAVIVRAFNTWAYKREQPSDPAMLQAAVAACVAEQRPVSFVLYWGKGVRNSVAGPEMCCLDYLAGMAAKVAAVHKPGASFTLLLTDTHAALNNHRPAAIDAYFASVGAEAQRRGFASRRLSDVVEKRAGTGPKLIFTRRAGEHQSTDRAACADIAVEVLDQLTACAAKWYGGEGDAARGAREYLAMNMIEKRAVEAAYPGSIFVTFNGSDFRAMFPDGLPVFYMYSIKKGIAVKPWFLAEADMPLVRAPVSATANATPGQASVD